MMATWLEFSLLTESVNAARKKKKNILVFDYYSVLFSPDRFEAGVALVHMARLPSPTV